MTAGTVRLETYAATEDLPDPAPPASAPDGLGLYLPGQWRLSNVNWWPDFPTSAEAAAEMFRRQGGGRVDGVLALTEYTTARLIGAVGPLPLPSYAAPVVEAGFDRRAVFEVEQKNPADQPRKKFLIELADALFGRLLDLPAGKLPAVASAVRASVGTGDIQLWFADPGRQALLAGTAVSGALPKTDGDFLMVVDANLAAGKSNLDVVKRVDYRAGLDARGRLVGHVHVDVQNTGPPSSINPLYNDYLRVYVPVGTELLDPSGRQASSPARDGDFQVFTQPLVVRPMDHGVADFSYVLPDHVRSGAGYRLTWVRQAGTPNDQLRAVVDGRSTTADAAVRTLRITAPQDRHSMLSWLRRRWLVRRLAG